jgi:hypothetical protein
MPKYRVIITDHDEFTDKDLERLFAGFRVVFIDTGDWVNDGCSDEEIRKHVCEAVNDLLEEMQDDDAQPDPVVIYTYERGHRYYCQPEHGVKYRGLHCAVCGEQIGDVSFGVREIDNRVHHEACETER